MVESTCENALPLTKCVSKLCKIVMETVDIPQNQLDSYRDFLNSYVGDIVQRYSVIEITKDLTEGINNESYTFRFEISNVRLKCNDMTHMECIQKHATHSISVMCDIIYTKTVVNKSETDASMDCGDRVPPEAAKYTYHNMLFCTIPLMVGAYDDMYIGSVPHSYGLLDLSGTFIINGKHRFIPMNKTSLSNVPFIVEKAKTRRIQMRCIHPFKSHQSTATLEIFIQTKKRKFSVGGSKFSSVVDRIMFDASFTSVPIPVFELLFLCGITSFVGFYDQLVSLFDRRLDSKWKKKSCVMESMCFDLKRLYDARDSNGSSVSSGDSVPTKCPFPASISEYNLNNGILPNLGVDASDVPKKGAFVVRMIYELFCVEMGVDDSRDRDDYKNVRVKTSGVLMANMFRTKVSEYMAQNKKILRRTISKNIRASLDIYKIFNTVRLNRKIQSAVATGMWTDKLTGISHNLTITNQMAIHSQVRRISNNQILNSGKHTKPRMVQHTQYGYVCGSETPEGEGCGLIENLAHTCTVTSRIDNYTTVRLMYAAAREIGITTTEFDAKNKRAMEIYTESGVLEWSVTDYCVFSNVIRDMKRLGTISCFVTHFVCKRNRLVYIFTDEGRYVRPLFRLDLWRDELPSLDSIRCTVDAVRSGYIEYVCASEESMYAIGFTNEPKSWKKKTHLELCDTSFLGLSSATSTPWVSHNQGPRVVYWSNMLKQAVTCMGTNYDTYNCPVMYSLHYSQRPIVQTKAIANMGISDVENGVNVMIAFLADEFNQEDAIVFSKSSIDRGMFTLDNIKIYECNRHDSGTVNTYEKFEVPDEGTTFGMKRHIDYGTIGDNGLPRIGQYISKNQVVIGKTVPNLKLSHQSKINVTGDKTINDYISMRTDASVSVKDDINSGIVVKHNVFVKNHTTVANVYLKHAVRPKIGDKFSSRYAQKGTNGRCVDECDMPYSQDTGIVPDALVSPLSLTSRMTVGMMMESLFSKAVCTIKSGPPGNCRTNREAFSADQFIDKQNLGNEDVQEQMKAAGEILESFGLKANGVETFINGKTGEKIECEVFCGLVHYNRLNHLIEKKTHARSRGPVQSITRQPCEGRRVNGGLRFGKMEIDAVIAHGGSNVLRENLYTSSDPFVAHVCGQCGQLCESNEAVGWKFCSICISSDHIRKVHFPHSSKTMVQELAATGVKMSFTLTDEVE